jgi:hypothetical protein
MRKLLFVAFPLLVLGSVAMAQAKTAAMAQAKPAAMAQHKIDTKWHCLKASEQHQLDAGDMPGHSYGIAQGSCDATSSGSGLAEKTGQYTESQEMWTASMKSHGDFISTLDNGDKIHYTYQFSGPTDPAKPMSNKWTIVSGTGTHKGIKGSGTCSGKSNAADGSIDWVCIGTYSMGK